VNALTENLRAPPGSSAPAPLGKGRVSLFDWFLLPARLATRQLFFERARLLSAIAGVMFAALLVFMQLGFRAALFDSATRLYAAMQAEVFLMNPLTMASFRPEPLPRIRAHQALALPEVAQAVPVYLTQAAWRSPETGAKRAIQMIGFDVEAGAMRFEGLDKIADALRQVDAAGFDVRSRPEFGDVAKKLAGCRYSGCQGKAQGVIAW
jgi:putative ABC transport system permease protein